MNLQMSITVSGFYLLVGLVVVFVSMEYDKGAKKTFNTLIQLHVVAWLAGIIFGAIIWPLIVVEQVKRMVRAWRHPALKWQPGNPEFDEAVGKAVRKNLASNTYLKEKIGKFIEQNPKCLRCGVEGKLRQYDLSLWVICDACKGRVFTPAPSTPESVDQVPALQGLPPCGKCRAPVLDWEEQKIKWKSIAVGKGLLLTSMDPGTIRCKDCRETI